MVMMVLLFLSLSWCALCPGLWLADIVVALGLNGGQHFPRFFVQMEHWKMILVVGDKKWLLTHSLQKLPASTFILPLQREQIPHEQGIYRNKDHKHCMLHQMFSCAGESAVKFVQFCFCIRFLLRGDG